MRGVDVEGGGLEWAYDGLITFEEAMVILVSRALPPYSG